MDESTLYVRYRGRVAGPFGLEELRTMRRAGRLTRLHEVSPDRTAWMPAMQHPALAEARTTHAAAGRGDELAVEAPESAPASPSAEPRAPDASVGSAKEPDAGGFVTWPCPGCGERLTLEASAAGEEAECPSCGRASIVPRRSWGAPTAAVRHRGGVGAMRTDDDFTESLDKNRDPFRSYLTEFAQPQQRLVTIQRKGLLSRYSLDELRLIAVVSGRVRPRAMFLDPSGLGVAVRRGDYIGKSFGKVKEILTDKVIIEIQEISENRQRVADRVIELHPEQAVGKVDDGNGALR